MGRTGGGGQDSWVLGKQDGRKYSRSPTHGKLRCLSRARTAQHRGLWLPAPPLLPALNSTNTTSHSHENRRWGPSDLLCARGFSSALEGAEALGLSPPPQACISRA